MDAPLRLIELWKGALHLVSDANDYDTELVFEVLRAGSVPTVSQKCFMH